jgi:large subunit ribosomal protein L21
MFAIVSIAGQQFKVTKDSFVYVHRLKDEVGSAVQFTDVLLTANGSTINVGQPVVPGAVVKATVQEHLKGDKILVFKKKRRKGYQKMNGHRQYLTKVYINEIVG